MTTGRKFTVLTADDMEVNLANQLMMCILIDASYSMREHGKMDAVNNALNKFIENAKSDIRVCDGLDLCVITFGGRGAEILEDFKNVRYFKDHYNIVPSGGTPLADALDFAIDQMENRHNRYVASGQSLFRPWLIIISDGNSDQPIDRQAAEIQRMYHRHGKGGFIIKGKCIGLGSEEDCADLRKIAPDHHVETMNSFQITDFFSLLSRSVVKVSESSPDLDDEKVEINV